MIKRIIRWEVNGPQYARGFIFGNYGWSVADYAKLVKQAKQDFPSLTDDNIEPGKVVKSTYMNKFKVVSFPLEPTQAHPDYDVCNKWDFELA